MPDEEKEKLSEGEKLYNLTQSDEWTIFKGRMDDIVLRLADIRNIPFELQDKEGKSLPIPAEQRTYEMQVRERTLMYLQQIMQGVTSDVEEYKDLMKELTIDRKDNDCIIRFDN